jgi:hypothetical protein
MSCILQCVLECDVFFGDLAIKIGADNTDSGSGWQWRRRDGCISRSRWVVAVGVFENS